MFKNSDKEKIIGTFMGNGYGVKLEENTVIFLKRGEQPFLFDLSTNSDISEMLVVANVLKVTEVSKDKSIGKKILEKNYSTSEVVDIIYDSVVENFDNKKLDLLRQGNTDLEEIIKSDKLSREGVEIFENVIALNNGLIDKFNECEEVVERDTSILAVPEVQDGMGC